MSAVVERLVFEDVWHGLYGESWKGLIHDDAFAHPAKFSRALVRKIYDHVIAEGWAKPGDRVIDPFGGVALGGFDAMRHGLYWHGHELEEKFVKLGNQNIALWNERFSRMPNWGVARLIQGDSRRLTAVWAGSSCCVTPPPYANDTVNDRNGIDLSKVKKPGGHNSQSRKMTNYGEASGQLGAMPEGQLCVSSPPYAANEKSDYLMTDDGKTRRRDVKRGFKQGHGSFRGSESYGDTEGQLGRMRDKEGSFDCAVSSPPYEGSLSTVESCDNVAGTSVTTKYQRSYGKDAERQIDQPRDNGNGRFLAKPHDNIGNQSGDTFWSASRLILQQLHQVIVPGGHAVFVVKAFVRDKKIVDFPGQWAQLCEATGFRFLHHHRASLVEHSGTQGGFHEDKEIRVERKSFFRRLAESKGSPRIDHESVLCFERIG
jgi:hypothetical protein